MKKTVILVGGGKSVREGISLGLWEKICEKEIWSLNYPFMTMPYLPKRELFVDRNFYKNNISAVQSIADRKVEIVCRYQPHYADDAHEKAFKMYQTTKEKAAYKGKQALEADGTPHIYVGEMGLVGTFALSLAIAEKYEVIYLCFDDKTEVFTNFGWRYFKDLNGNELILTRKYNGKTEWSPILNKIVYDYNGKMYHLQSKGIDLLVTGEHKFGLISKKHKKYIWKKVIDFNKNSSLFIPKTFSWKGENKEYFILSKVEISNNKDIKIKMNDWLKFLGLYLAEGCVSISKHTKKGYKTTIYQSHTKKKDIFIINILKHIPFHFKYHKRGWIIYSTQLAEYLRQFGNSFKKYIPKEIKELSPKYLKILLKCLVFGDGFRSKVRTSFSYSTSSKRLSSDVQEIAYKLGYYAEIYSRYTRPNKLVKYIKGKKRQYRIDINNSRKSGNISKISMGNLVFHGNIKRKQYNGKIYDITVKNHTLWVRRNNKCVWSGNCGYDFGPQSYEDKDTHYYQGKLDVISTGVEHPEIYLNKDSTPLSNVADFKVFTQEKDVQIYNVSLQSNIPYFTKISYEIFFTKIKKVGKNV